MTEILVLFSHQGRVDRLTLPQRWRGRFVWRRLPRRFKMKGGSDLTPPPQIPEPNSLKVVVIFDGDRIVFADYADADAVRQIVQIIQKHKFITH